MPTAQQSPPPPQTDAPAPAAPVPAVAIGDSRWSADACATVVARIGRQLSGQGLRAGDIVLRATDDPVHLLLMQHALAYAG
ncbi:MAG: AMP-dependent synthetase, partial [Thiohalocapsa sp.]